MPFATRGQRSPVESRHCPATVKTSFEVESGRLVLGCTKRTLVEGASCGAVRPRSLVPSALAESHRMKIKALGALALAIVLSISGCGGDGSPSAATDDASSFPVM